MRQGAAQSAPTSFPSTTTRIIMLIIVNRSRLLYYSSCNCLRNTIISIFVLFDKEPLLVLENRSLPYVHLVEIPLTFADKDVYNS